MIFIIYFAVIFYTFLLFSTIKYKNIDIDKKTIDTLLSDKDTSEFIIDYKKSIYTFSMFVTLIILDIITILTFTSISNSIISIIINIIIISLILLFKPTNKRIDRKEFEKSLKHNSIEYDLMGYMSSRYTVSTTADSRIGTTFIYRLRYFITKYTSLNYLKFKKFQKVYISIFILSILTYHYNVYVHNLSNLSHIYITPLLLFIPITIWYIYSRKRYNNLIDYTKNRSYKLIKTILPKLLIILITFFIANIQINSVNNLNEGINFSFDNNLEIINSIILLTTITTIIIVIQAKLMFAAYLDVEKYHNLNK